MASKRRIVFTAICVAVLLILSGGWIAMVASSKASLDSDLVIDAKLGDAKELNQLLAKGANPNAREDRSGDDGRSGIVELVKSLVHWPGRVSSLGDTALIGAVRSPHPFEATEALLIGSANPNMDGSSGSPLCWAAGNGDKRTMLLLISKGADVNARDSLGTTPISSARLDNREDLVKLLKDHGATDK